MSFTPLQCGAGGLVIGTVAAWNAVINGRVTGISGATTRALKSIVPVARLRGTGTFAYDDILFIAGLIFGGFVFAQTMPLSFGGGFVGSIWRIALAGFAVGFGTNVANGCTSGHGVCGIARLRIRSVVNVIVFMLTAMATAALSGTANLYRSIESVGMSSSSFALPQVSTGIAVVIGVPLVLATISKQNSRLKDGVSKFLYFFLGAAFAYGLSVAKMTQSRKVIGFLDVVSSYWDPSLLFVFLGALPVAFLGFQMLAKKNKQPLLCEKATLPTSTAIDKKLLVGGLIFGFGWGLEGYCPGPALVNLGANPLNPNIIIFCAALAAGTLLSELRKRIILESKT